MEIPWGKKLSGCWGVRQGMNGVAGAYLWKHLTANVGSVFNILTNNVLFVKNMNISLTIYKSCPKFFP